MMHENSNHRVHNLFLACFGVMRVGHVEIGLFYIVQEGEVAGRGC